MELCVEKAAMPRAYFIKTFPGNEEDLNWVGREVGARKSYSEVLSRFAPAVLEQQQALIDLQKRVGIPGKDLKEINRQMSTGEAQARRAKREMTEADLRPASSRAENYS